MYKTEFFFQHVRFHLEPKGPLHMPAYNKGNVTRGGFGSMFACLRIRTRRADRVSWELTSACS